MKMSAIIFMPKNIHISHSRYKMAKNGLGIIVMPGRNT